MRSDDINVLLVDDHLVVRKGILHVLQNTPKINVVGEAEDGEEAIFLARKLKPDIVLMDIQMGGMGGIRTAQLITEFNPNTRVIGLSTFADAETVGQMIDAGASGYLQKSVSATQLIRAIVCVHSGKTLPLPSVSDNSLTPGHTVSNQAASEQPRELGEQQQKVLALLTKGFTNPEIAEQLKVSLPTARYHVSAILQKLEVSNRSEAVALAVRNNLVSKDDFQ